VTGGTFVEKKHSGLGISSFIISTAIGVLMFLLFIVAGVMETSTPGGIDEDSTGAMLVGLFLIAFLVLDLLAIGLGIAGLIQKDRKKIFSILGVVFGASTIVITIFLMIIGLMA
jgi:hypothetical protein